MGGSNKEGSAQSAPPTGRLILDGHKLGFHMDRVEAWELGERIAPVGVDMALTRACGALCSFCYAMLQEAQERPPITTGQALSLVEQFAEIGVRSVSLISDGESTLSKAYIPFIQRAAELGIDVGNATNGWEWPPETIEAVLPHLSWVRFTVAAGTAQGYSDIMFKGPNYPEVFDRAMDHIRYAVELKRRKSLSVTLGIQMVLMPAFEGEILPFAQLAIDLGVDYGVIKHCSDDEVGSLGVDYAAYEALYPSLEAAEAMSTEQTQIIVKWSKIRDVGINNYRRFYGPQFLLQISGSGLVAPAGNFFNQKFSKLHIGNFTEERFIDMFRSDRYWRPMEYLASPAFDAGTMMGTLPISHYVSTALDRHVRGVERILPNSDSTVLHKNFL